MPDEAGDAREVRARRAAQLSRLALAIAIGFPCALAGRASAESAQPAPLAQTAPPADAARAADSAPNAPSGAARELSYAERSCLPEWVARALEARDIAARYTPSAWLNPFALRARLDADTLADYAVTAIENRSGKRGVLIVHRGDLSVHVVGAGAEMGAGGDDFAWMDAWRVVERAEVEAEAPDAPRVPGAPHAPDGAMPPLADDALWVAKTESASALIWWDGRRYRWRQQGD